MPIITDRAAALARLRLLVQPAADPVLDEDTEFAPLLASNQRATVWAAATAYVFGDVVIPTEANRNGRRFVCVESGASGSVEPSWPTSREATTGDGDATWQEAGREFDLWDLNKAARDGWLSKAGKASEYADKTVSQNSKSEQQIYDHCVSQAKIYATVTIG